MSRPRRQGAPDWPKSLQLPVKALDETGPAPTLEQVRAAIPATAPQGVAVAPPVPKPAPLTAFLFVRTKDGHHLAAEVQVDGAKVLSMVPLCLSLYAQESAKAWEACAFYRLCHGREYTATEREANRIQGKGARLEDVAEGYAVALVKRSGKTAALSMEVDGVTVKEPKVLAVGDRTYAWQEAHAFAQRWFLPRRKVK